MFARTSNLYSMLLLCDLEYIAMSEVHCHASLHIWSSTTHKHKNHLRKYFTPISTQILCHMVFFPEAVTGVYL